MEKPSGRELDKFWHLSPRIVEALSYNSELRSQTVTFAWDGLVVFRESFTGSMHCDFDITRYPFDEHICNITILVSDAEVVEFLNADWRGPSVPPYPPSHADG